MADTQKQIGAGAFLVLPAFLAWALVAVGIVVHEPPLHTCRPEAKAFSEPAVGVDESLPARLWQDPLQTAYQAHQEYLDAKEAAPSTSIIDAVRDKVLRCVGRSTPADSGTSPCRCCRRSAAGRRSQRRQRVLRVVRSMRPRRRS